MPNSAEFPVKIGGNVGAITQNIRQCLFLPM